MTPIRERREVVDEAGTLLGWAGKALGSWSIFCAGCDWVAVAAPGDEFTALEEAPTCPGGRPRTSKPSSSLSTTGPARPSPGEPQPRPSTITYAHFNSPVLQRPIEHAHYASILYTEHLAEIGADPSIGTVGDSYDNAMAESVMGLFKTELHRNSAVLTDNGGPGRDSTISRSSPARGCPGSTRSIVLMGSPICRVTWRRG